MRKDIHPKNNLVVFKDGSNGAMFLTKSTLNSKETIKYIDGKEYPLITVEITSKSHPFILVSKSLLMQQEELINLIKGIKSPKIGFFV